MWARLSLAGEPCRAEQHVSPAAGCTWEPERCASGPHPSAVPPPNRRFLGSNRLAAASCGTCVCVPDRFHPCCAAAHLVPRLDKALGQELAKGAEAHDADLERVGRLHPHPHAVLIVKREGRVQRRHAHTCVWVQQAGASSACRGPAFSGRASQACSAAATEPAAAAPALSPVGGVSASTPAPALSGYHRPAQPLRSPDSLLVRLPGLPRWGCSVAAAPCGPAPARGWATAANCALHRRLEPLGAGFWVLVPRRESIAVLMLSASACTVLRGRVLAKKGGPGSPAAVHWPVSNGWGFPIELEGEEG